MWLVDADALKESVRKKFKALPDRCEINELVNAAPIIDAIPVEWLQQKMFNADAVGSWYTVDTIKWLIETWQKEQEVR